MMETQLGLNQSKDDLLKDIILRITGIEEQSRFGRQEFGELPQGFC